MTLQPITTSNLISVVQILVVVAGFFFSWRTLDATRESIKTASSNLRLTTENAQAQLYNQMVIQGRDLQYKYMEIYFADQNEESSKKRQDLYTGTVISYYAACFGLRGILNLPQSVTKLLDDELKQLLKQEGFRKKWDNLSDNFSKEFIAHVNSLKGV